MFGHVAASPGKNSFNIFSSQGKAYSRKGIQNIFKGRQCIEFIIDVSSVYFSCVIGSIDLSSKFIGVLTYVLLLSIFSLLKVSSQLSYTIKFLKSPITPSIGFFSNNLLFYP